MVTLKTTIERFLELQKPKKKEWVDTFEDEDTGEVIQIERSEVLTEEHSFEEEQLLEKIYNKLTEIDTSFLLEIKKITIWGNMDSEPLLYELYKRGAINLESLLIIKDGVAKVPDGLEYIPVRHFSDCTKLHTIIIPNSVVEIGDCAFSNCTSLVNIHIPNSVRRIGNHAFYGCEALTSIHIPDSVTEIGDYTFMSCINLQTIHISKNIEVIGNRAFCCCRNLGSIIIPEGVKYILPYAFQGCISVKEVSIPSTIKNICFMAFDACLALRTITIPETIVEIDSEAFSECAFLSDGFVNNSSLEGSFGAIIGDIIQEDGIIIKDNIVVNCIPAAVSVTIPEGTITIAELAFGDCDILEVVNMPNTLKTIENYAFAYCKSLKSITIPNSVTRIDDNAFYTCENLKDIIFDGTIEEWKVIDNESYLFDIVHCTDGNYVGE